MAGVVAGTMAGVATGTMAGVVTRAGIMAGERTETAGEDIPCFDNSSCT